MTKIFGIFFLLSLLSLGLAGDSPAGSAPAGTPPAGTPPAGSAPAGTPPAGSAPAASAPAGSAPASSPPAGSAPASNSPSMPSSSPSASNPPPSNAPTASQPSSPQAGSTPQAGSNNMQPSSGSTNSNPTDGENNEDGDDENTEQYFKTPEIWFQNYKKRFDAVLKTIPNRSTQPVVQRNINVANSFADEILRLNARRQLYMGRENAAAVSFMQGQEARLKRLGLFTHPMTWAEIRCGAGYLSTDCGRIGKDQKTQ